MPFARSNRQHPKIVLGDAVPVGWAGVAVERGLVWLGNVAGIGPCDEALVAAILEDRRP
jgi:hypothetical protein